MTVGDNAEPGSRRICMGISRASCRLTAGYIAHRSFTPPRHLRPRAHSGNQILLNLQWNIHFGNVRREQVDHGQQRDYHNVGLQLASWHTNGSLPRIMHFGHTVMLHRLSPDTGPGPELPVSIRHVRLHRFHLLTSARRIYLRNGLRWLGFVHPTLPKYYISASWRESFESVSS